MLFSKINWNHCQLSSNLCSHEQSSYSVEFLTLIASDLRPCRRHAPFNSTDWRMSPLVNQKHECIHANILPQNLGEKCVNINGLWLAQVGLGKRCSESQHTTAILSKMASIKWKMRHHQQPPRGKNAGSSNERQ